MKNQSKKQLKNESKAIINKILTAHIMLLLALSALLAACGDNPATVTPEEKLRQWLTQMETAVKAKALGDIKSLISPDYADADGNTRQKIMLKITLLFRQYDTVGLSNSIQEIDATPSSGRLVLDTTFSQSQAFAQLGLANNHYQFVLLFEPDGDDYLLNNVSYHRNAQ